jgi:hypothetical protein
MRTNMDPLAPTTHTLSPAISHIAETAASLSSSMHALAEQPAGLGIDIQVDKGDEETETKKKREKETVRWVLDSPRRLQECSDQDDEEGADKDWAEVSKILDKWRGVAGVQELREQCEDIMREEENSE